MYLASDKREALRMFEQLSVQFRSHIVRPMDRTNGNLREKFAQGVTFDDSIDSHIGIFLRFPQTLSFVFKETTGEEIVIDFQDVIAALQTCEDRGWRIAFDKDVLRAAIRSVVVGTPLAVSDAADQIIDQLKRLTRDYALYLRSIDDIYESLSATDERFLLALSDLGCVDCRSRKKIVDIALKDDPESCPNDGFKRCAAQLQNKVPAIIKKHGKQGGFWLTQSGQEVVRRIQPDVRTSAPPTK